MSGTHLNDTDARLRLKRCLYQDIETLSLKRGYHCRPSSRLGSSQHDSHAPHPSSGRILSRMPRPSNCLASLPVCLTTHTHTVASSRCLITAPSQFVFLLRGSRVGPAHRGALPCAISGEKGRERSPSCVPSTVCGALSLLLSLGHWETPPPRWTISPITHLLLSLTLIRHLLPYTFRYRTPSVSRMRLLGIVLVSLLCVSRGFADDETTTVAAETTTATTEASTTTAAPPAETTPEVRPSRHSRA